MSTTKRIVSVLGAALAAIGAAACGYQLAGTQVRAPGGIESIAVGEIENRSREFEIGKALAFAFERELFDRGIVRIEEDPAKADAILTGKIASFSTRPVSYDASDEALQYEAELVCDFVLKRRDDGTVLWKTSEMTEVDEFDVASRIVVPSTSQFQQGVTSTEDLRNMTDIQLAESTRRLAIERLTAAMMRDVYDRILEDF